MFWADKKTEQIKTLFKEKIKAGEELIIRDEKTASGRAHVGSMRGVAIHGIINEILKEEGVKNKFLWEINDIDPMDDLPIYIDEEKYSPQLGKPLMAVSSPEEGENNFAEYYGKEFANVIENTGFHPEYYRGSWLYDSGKMNELIDTALRRAGDIREIYKMVSGSEKPEGWYPLKVICDNCGKIDTTEVISFDGEKVQYRCLKEAVDYTNGCGYEGEKSPFDGNAKMPWKVEWAAKFKALDVDIEGNGKDHSTRGGSRDVANHISKEVFNYEPPFDIPYEFFLVEGKKMSSSKGAGSSAKEISQLLPTTLFRLSLIGKNPKKTIDFKVNGETIPNLYDLYDQIAEKYFNNAQDDESRLFKLIHPPFEREKIEPHFMPRFSKLTFLTQMPHIDIKEETAKMKEKSLTEADKEELEERLKYADNWLEEFAPEDYKFELQEELPESAKNLTAEQKEALKDILKLIKNKEQKEQLEGQELHTQLHNIRKEKGMDPREFFSALYVILLNKNSGPKAGWFLNVLKKDFLEKRLEEAINI